MAVVWPARILVRGARFLASDSGAGGSKLSGALYRSGKAADQNDIRGGVARAHL